jgi:hypothetical protein
MSCILLTKEIEYELFLLTKEIEYELFLLTIEIESHEPHLYFIQTMST